jgi:hypothetical protein
MTDNSNSQNPFPFSDVKPYPWLPTPPPSEPQYGLLGRLVPEGQLSGIWVNIPTKDGPKGMHTTIMPSPGTSSEQMFGVFHFKSQEYTEVLRFKKIKDAVRNRGGTNEQFSGAIEYHTVVTDLEGITQHVENGMYLWLGNSDTESTDYPGTMFRQQSTAETVLEDDGFPVLNPGQQGPQFVPPYSISRGGVIPHGTTVHIMGNYEKDQAGAPLIAPIWDQPTMAISPSMGINLTEDLIPNSTRMPEWTLLKVPHRGEEVGKPGFLDPNSGRAYIHKIFVYDQFGARFPYTVQPNIKLTDANKDLSIKSHDLITLDSRHDTGPQGGVLNNVMVGRYCRTARMRLRMWIERVDLGPEKGVVDQLQYEQIVDFEFMFGSSGGTTLWPHIQVNTLRRQEDVEAGRY